MKADVAQQRSVLELAGIDAELTRIAHRTTNLDEHKTYTQLQTQAQGALDRVSVLGIAVEDLDGQVSRLETEIDGVRQREDRDRALLASASTNAKQLTELQHELDTLSRRQASLEDTLLEVMERREALIAETDAARAAAAELAERTDAAAAARDNAVAYLDHARAQVLQQRDVLVAGIDPELLVLYDRVGAGALQGRRCGSCRLDLDRGELSRISAAAPDEVLRCPECGAILVRQ